MIVTNDPKFNPEFPEKYRWSLIDSHHLTDVVERIVELIREDLRSKDRDMVAGLRAALRIIADNARIQA